MSQPTPFTTHGTYIATGENTYTGASNWPENAAPTFSVGTGSYVGAQYVTISSELPGTIYYTISGSNPTTATFNRCVDSCQLEITSSLTLKAIVAWSTLGQTAQSAVASATYTITAPPAPTSSLASGTYYGTQKVVLSAAPGSYIYYTLDGTTPTAQSTLYSSPIYLRLTTQVNAVAIEGISSTVSRLSYNVTTWDFGGFIGTQYTYTQSGGVYTWTEEDVFNPITWTNGCPAGYSKYQMAGTRRALRPAVVRFLWRALLLLAAAHVQQPNNL